MKPKPILLAILMMATAATAAWGQLLTVTLNLTARPNPYISEWASRRETAILTVTNPGARPVDAKISVKILIGTTLQAESKFNELPVFTIPAHSTQTFYGEDLVPFNAMKFYGGAETKTLRTGQLPAGSYTFCLRLLDPVSAAPLSPEVCRPFTIASYQSPSLLLPADRSAIRAEDRPTFRWTPVTPNPPTQITYRFLLFEVMAGQAPMAAFRGNQPIVERMVPALAQLLWLPEFPSPEPGMTYIWTVQALDPDGNPIGDPDGFASPFVFTVNAPLGERRNIDGGVGIGRNPGGGVIDTLVDGGNGGAGRVRNNGGAVDTLVDGGNGGARMARGNGNAVDTLVDMGGAGVQQRAANNGNDANVAANLIAQANPQAPANTCGNPAATCPAPACVTYAPGTFADGDSVTICNFTMKFTGAPTGTSSSLTGTGKIWVPWMRTNVAVTFSNIKINSTGQVCSGVVMAAVDSTPAAYPQQWAINMVGSFNWTKKQVKDLNAWLHQQGPAKLKKLTDSLDLNQMLAEQTAPPVNVPLGFNNLEGVTIAISEMKFEPTGAHLNCVAAFPIVFDHNDTLGFKGANFPFSPTAPQVGAGKLGLLADEIFSGNIINNLTYEITFKAEHLPAPGTFVSWGCKGFRELNVDMQVAFPRQWLVPIPDNGTDRVKASVLTNVVSWKDWLIQTSLPRCAIANSNGLEMEVQAMVYDHSDTRNLPGMTFPTIYTGDSTEAFHGFYLKSASVDLPDKLRTFNDPAQRVKIIIPDLIIDKLGVTGDLLAQNVVNFPNGNISGLGASIDTIRISVRNSSLLSAYMRGRIVLPVSDITAPNAITYKALFNTNNGFLLTMKPDHAIDAKLFAGAKLTLAETSTMSMTISGGQTAFDLTLNGKFDWSDVKIGNKVKVTMKDLEFQNMKMAYTENSGMTFQQGTWGFASPPKWLAHFPITIEKIRFDMKTKSPGEVLRGALSFDVVLNLSENAVSGRSTMEVTGAIDKPAGGNFAPRLVGVSVKEIDIHANTAAVKMDGKINFYNDDPTYGDGFQGALKAVFNSVQMQIDASARFGTTEYQSPGNSYRYWGVEAKAILPKPGIVFLPGVAFYGFGAGAWKRMNVTGMTKPDVNAVAGATTTSTQTSSGAVFTPNPNNGFGFKVTTVLGTVPDPKTFNADATLLGEFSVNGGLTKIEFALDAWGGAKLLERNTAPIYGNATISYVPPTKVFDLNALVNLKYPADGSVVKTTAGGISLKLNINGSTGLWYFKLGEPANPNTVLVFNTYNVQQYLMFGNNIQPQTGFLPSTIQGLSQAGVSVGFQNQGISSQASLGQGFAAGFTIFGGTGNQSVDLMYRTQLRFAANGGFEINMSMLRYPPTTLCDGTPLGMNGWYAQGGIAGWFNGYAGIHIDHSPKPDCDCCPKVWKDCCNPFKCCAIYCGEHYYNVLDIKIGARLNGGFPRPSWLTGQASGSFSFLGGTIAGNFTANLAIGKQCSIGQPEQNAAFTAEDAVATIDQQGTLLLSVNPENGGTGHPPDNAIGVVCGFKPDDAFEVLERQADGTVRKRTFQARYSAQLDSLGPVVNAPVPVLMVPNVARRSAPPPVPPVLRRSAAANPLGEYEYRVDRGIIGRLGVWVKNLDDNIRYRFTVTGELWEKQGNNWARATRRNGQQISETMTSAFSTGVSPRIAPGAPTPGIPLPPPGGGGQ
ncbi:MAG: hypothetical protein JWQ98_3301 [Chlorobi bacterium]|nr:hypothetical protein [Chlorobiota bacterium]